VRLIASNAGVEGDVVIEKLLGKSFEIGYNAVCILLISVYSVITLQKLRHQSTSADLILAFTLHIHLSLISQYLSVLYCHGNIILLCKMSHPVNPAAHARLGASRCVRWVVAIVHA